MNRRGALVGCLALLILTSGCIGLLTGDDEADAPRPTYTVTETETTSEPGFWLAFDLNESVSEGIAFDYTVTNELSEEATAELVAVARGDDGTTVEEVRTLTLEAGEERTVTVVFEEFDNYDEATMTADVTRVGEDS
jgi:hypothetical protein